MTKDNSRSRLNELRILINESEGKKILDEFNQFNASVYTLNKNHSELKGVLLHFKDDLNTLELMTENNRKELKEFHLEVVRLLHNFVASAMSLVDHTRVYIHSLYGQEHPFLVLYNNKKEEVIISASISKFVQDLRNYTVHRGLPLTTAQLSFSVGNGFTSSISLNISEMRNWNGWKTKSKEYMSQYDRSIDLLNLIDDYFHLTFSFYNWTIEEQKKIHVEAFANLEALTKEYNELLDFNNG